MKSVFVHGVLALLGLAWAYQTWTRAPEADDSESAEVIVTPCTQDGLQQLSMDTPTLHIAVEPQRQKAGSAYWITTQRKTETKTPLKTDVKAEPVVKDGVTKAVAEPQPAVVAPEPVKPVAMPPRRFLANAAFSDYLKRLTPVRALRALGQLPKGKLADFGFADVGTHIGLQCSGKVLDLEVGARTFGTGQRYVRDAKTKDAYLVDESFISDLQSAQFKFMQTDLHNFELSEIDEASLAARGGKKRLLHRDRKLADRALWVDASAPTTRNELYGNWFARLGRLRVREFLADGAQPGSDVPGASGETTPVLTIEYASDGKSRGKLELVRIDAAGQSRYYARSETTKTWVSLYDSSAKDVEQDLGLVVGVEEPKAASTPVAASVTPAVPGH